MTPTMWEPGKCDWCLLNRQHTVRARDAASIVHVVCRRCWFEMVKMATEEFSFYPDISKVKVGK